MARARNSGSQDTQPRARSDAYVGLLFISLLAQITGAVFFFLDWNQYPSNKPTEPPKITTPAPPPGPQQPAPAPGGGVPAPGVPGGGMAGMAGGMAGMGGGMAGGMKK